MKDILFVTENIETPLKSVYLSNNDNSYDRIKKELDNGKRIIYGLITDMISIRLNSKTLNALLCPFKHYEKSNVEKYYEGYLNNFKLTHHSEEKPYYATNFNLKDVDELYKAKYIGLFLIEQDGTVSECFNLIKIVNPNKDITYNTYQCL